MNKEALSMKRKLSLTMFKECRSLKMEERKIINQLIISNHETSNR